MSGGALAQLVAKGIQDAYCIQDDPETKSLFVPGYRGHTNFAEEPARLDIVGNIQPGSTTEIELTKQGDLVNAMWLEGTNIIDYLSGTTFELRIGEQLIDTQTFEYMSEIWGVYLADTNTKSRMMNNKLSQADKNFFPLQFWFCQMGNYLPLLAITNHRVYIRAKWGSGISGTTPKVYANYIFLDTRERKHIMAKEETTMAITQVQREAFQVDGGDVKLDLSSFNHPVKALFWGQDATDTDSAADYFTYDSASIMLEGKPLTDRMSPTYYHSVQGYYHTPNGNISFVNDDGTPFYTRYSMYSFARDASKRTPDGECNFSRLDNPSLHIQNIQRPVAKRNLPVQVYAINFNILKIAGGMAGVLFSN